MRAQQPSSAMAIATEGNVAMVAPPLEGDAAARVPQACEDFLSRKLSRYWKQFVGSRKTTLALAQAYDSLGISGESIKNMPFETLAMSMQSPEVLQATKALLDRFETRFVISHSSLVENIDHLLKRLSSSPAPPRKKRKTPPSSSRAAAAKAPPAAANPATSRSASRSARYSPRVALSAYMIVAHPDAVLSGQGEGEKTLMESAAIFVGELELLVKVILAGAAGRFRARLAGFDRAWCAYLYGFVAWKVKDARVLEGDLVRAACKLELSMVQTCRVDEHGQPPASGDLTHDMQAIREQVAGDQRLLREKVRQLSGGAGVQRMDSAIADARARFFEAKRSGSSVAAPVKNVSTPLSIDAPSGKNASPVKQPTQKELMVNELLHQDGVAFGVRSDDAATAEKYLEKRVKEIMEQAFWDVVTESIRGDKPDYSRLISLVQEVRDSLHKLAPKQWKEEIVENIDIEILSQVLGSGSQEAQHLGQILQYSLDMVRKLAAAAKEDEMKKSHGKLLAELAASSEVSNSNNGSSSFVIAVIKGLRFVLEEIRELQGEVSKACIQIMTQPIIKGSSGLEYLQEAFADRYGDPANASASLPLTLQWISTTRNVAEQEWREHSGSLSAMAGQAPAVVQVLRSGHGAPVAQQPPSSGSAAGASGQPECKGEKLDKLIRIGLLQLVSSMEGLQMQSTPESFQINLLRLRAVQSQFQQVIVIATSMLILRQVLTAESSKPTPVELEHAISELFESLVKTLDMSPDAGTGEIVEAMIRASASVGSPSSEEKIQARRQMIARMFVKSVQPGDAVFNMVSRAVHGAFRGVVLGGGGARGQKLADAALRRVGAAKLADRVVEAAEVLIKVATVSEKVHGAWYRALL